MRLHSLRMDLVLLEQLEELSRALFAACDSRGPGARRGLGAEGGVLCALPADLCTAGMFSPAAHKDALRRPAASRILVFT